MERLWAPWRIAYITSDKPSGCVFCQEGDDRELLILHRGEQCRIMLNRYPYCSGHLLVVPKRHTVALESLSEAEQLDLWGNVVLCQKILAQAGDPDGFNIGVNLGKAAGAGVDDHLHLHVVPRWNGDNNFMAVMADTRVLPEALFASYDRLLPLFQKAGGGR